MPPCHGQPHFPFWTFSSVHLFGFSPLSILLSAVLLVQETPSASFLDARCTLCSWLTRQEGFTFKLHFTRPPFPLCHSFFSDQILFSQIFSSRFLANVFLTLTPSSTSSWLTSCTALQCTGTNVFCGVKNLMCVFAPRSGWPFHLSSLYN